MVITGNSITNTFSLVNILLPLWPAWTLLVQRNRRPVWANWLLTLCIFNLLVHLLPLISFFSLFEHVIRPVADLIEFSLEFFLLRYFVTKGKAKDLTQLLLVAFLSVILTLYWQQGTNIHEQELNIIEAGVLISLALIGLIQLAFQRKMVIFNTPLFWIACGTLIYYSMKILVDLLAAGLPGSTDLHQQKMLMLTISNALRMTAFAVAPRIKPTTYF